MNRISNLQFFKLSVFFTFFITLASLGFAQAPEDDPELQRAKELISKSNYFDALPIIEKLVKKYPKDADLHAQLGIAIIVKAVSIVDPDKRRLEVQKAAGPLKKARALGTTDPLALDYLNYIETGVDLDAADPNNSPELNAAIREGEKYFAKGDFENARIAYEKALKIDPKSPEATLFIGDCYYGQKRYPQAIEWFRKAIEINPDMEPAHRFLADALALSGKTKEAIKEYAEAYIIRPSSRITRSAFFSAVENFGERTTNPSIEVPIKSTNGEIVIDETALNDSDGSINWLRFKEVRDKQLEEFAKVANGREFRSTVSEDVVGFRAVAEGLREELKKNPSLKLSQSLKNLLILDENDLLDVFTILVVHGADNSFEYEKFIDGNREKMIKFLVDYVAEEKL